MKNLSYLQIASFTLAWATLAGTSFSLGIVPVTGPPVGSEVAPIPRVAQDSGESTTLGGVEFAHLSFDDAMSRAERTEKLLVIFWAGDSPGKEQIFGDRIFGDKGVQRWLAEHATAVWINAIARKKDAKRNGLAGDLLPAIDILDVARGGRLERLTSEGSATQFLAAVFGSMDAKQPEGDDTQEPFSWLAWANARYRDPIDPNSGSDAVAGYDWCLLNADKYRPGFRAKYFEFLLQRIANCKQRTTKAVEVLLREHGRLAGMIMAGTATEADVYELTRVDFWTRKELTTRDVFVALTSKGTSFRKYQEWLFPTVVPILGRFEQYGEILQLVGDRHLKMFQSRIAALSEEDAGQPKEQVTVLDYALGDSRADIIDNASWVYEALLKAGRGKDANDLMTLITTTFPVNKSFGLFMERALRVKIWSAAAEIADIGISVLDERGQRRMKRLLLKIPTDTSKKN